MEEVMGYLAMKWTPVIPKNCKIHNIQLGRHLCEQIIKLSILGNLVLYL